MASVHDLDHIKLNLCPPPLTSSTHQPKRPSRSNQSDKLNHKLDYFLTLISSTKGTIPLIKLIQDLLSSDGLYVFGELLHTKPISDLATHPTHSSYHQLLEIFAYGTWKDYRERASCLPALSAAQARKLKQLSVISRAFQSRIIPYAELLELLEIQPVHELEELIIDGIYSGLLEARLDQKYLRVEVESCMGRDMRLTVPPAAALQDVDMDGCSLHAPTLGDLIVKLESWRDSTAGILAQLEQHINLIRHKDRANLEFEANHQAKIDTYLRTNNLSTTNSAVSNTTARGGGGGDPSTRKGKEKEGGLSDQTVMEIDEQNVSSSKTRKRTRA